VEKYEAWIASKVKSVTPVPPSGDATTVSPVVNNAPVKISGGSMAVPNADTLTVKGRRRKKPKTTPATTTGSTTASNDDEEGSSNGQDAVKEAIKRVVRALLNRQ